MGARRPIPPITKKDLPRCWNISWSKSMRSWNIVLSKRSRFGTTYTAVSYKDLPAITYYREDGKVEAEIWRNFAGLAHRDGNKPATIYYSADGTIQKEWYLLNGEVYSPNWAEINMETLTDIL